MKFTNLLFVLTAGVLTTLSTHAQVAITIQNNSFDTPDLSGVGYQYGIPDWVLSGNSNGNSGEQLGSTVYGGGSGIDGANFAFADNTDPVYQNLGTTFQAGTYVLTFALANRPGQGSDGGYFSLGTSTGTTLATSGPVNVGISGAPYGTFTDYHIDYTVLSGSTTIGQTIQVSFGGDNYKPSTGLENSDFDNARLNFTATAAPEPSTYAMLGLGFGGLVFLARRKLA